MHANIIGVCSVTKHTKNISIAYIAVGDNFFLDIFSKIVPPGGDLTRLARSNIVHRNLFLFEIPEHVNVPCLFFGFPSGAGLDFCESAFAFVCSTGFENSAGYYLPTA